MKYTDIISEPTPQSEALNETQVRNNAGGFVYQIDKWSRLDRFLILGSDAPTYYQQARALTLENAKVVRECYAEDAEKTVNRIVEISDSGRAPKNDPAIFALAIGSVSPDELTRQKALGALNAVCRTSTHLFSFVGAAKALNKGFGRAMKRAVANWYSSKTLDQVAYQAIKYRSREGFTHKRLLNMSHAPAPAEDRKNLYHWIKGKDSSQAFLPDIVRAHLEAMNSTDTAEWRQLITEFRLPWEALPTEANAVSAVWEAMLPHLGLTALIRNLGNMTRIGAISPLSNCEAEVVRRLGDETDLRKSRVHPFSILLADAVYSSGRGFKGSGTWTPSGPVRSALNRAFYKAFANVEPTGKRFLIALDVSGSMTAPFMGSPMSCRDATAALALVTMNTEDKTHVVGFTAKSGNSPTRFTWSGGAAELTQLPLTKGMTLQDAVAAVSDLPFGGTDCALPMIYALEKKIPTDVFIVLTDSETWAGGIHPSEALKKYRKEMGINAKLVVVGMTSTGFSIADPNDGGMLDVVGFDSNVPALIADFVRN
jgi:60 kDa SS-A/Ro ribonucleoprotein